jgi:probable phosphoglycerate mutase
MALPIVYAARHGETEWSRTGQHTGISDIPLTEAGERAAVQLGERLRKLNFAAVFTSPSQRARRTCELAGFGERAEVLPYFHEWNYGKYEGVRTADIQRERPGWDLFRDGCPDGENAELVGARADQVIAKAREVHGNVLLFSSSHILRVTAARWLGLPPTGGRYFILGTAALSAFGYEHDSVAEPIIRMWNDTSHIET